VVKITVDQHEEGIDGYGGNNFEKRKVLRWEWKTPWEMSTTSPGSQYDHEEELAGWRCTRL